MWCGPTNGTCPEVQAVDRDTAVERVLERAHTFRGHHVTASPLSGGHINNAYVVQVDGDQRYVVRIPGASEGTRVVSLDDERHNSVAAAHAGASPRVVEYLEDLGVMVVDFVVGEALTDENVGDRARIPRLAAALKRLHAGRPFRADFDMATVARAWLRVCVERAIPTPEGLSARMDRVDLAARALAARPMILVPCHNDLSADNLIDDGERVWLIDLEFSGNNDPCFDLADIATQAHLDPSWHVGMCEAYFGRADPVKLARMGLHATISGVGWAIWASIMDRTSPRDIDFHRYVSAFWEPARGMLDSDAFDRCLRVVSDGGERRRSKSISE
jgi:thiamine kinase-like enzyme